MASPRIQSVLSHFFIERPNSHLSPSLTGSSLFDALPDPSPHTVALFESLHFRTPRSRPDPQSRAFNAAFNGPGKVSSSSLPPSSPSPLSPFPWKAKA